MPSDVALSSGLPGLDAILTGFIAGDNVVWMIDDISAYQPFIADYVAAGQRQGQPVVVFRFADHPPLVAEGEGITIHEFNPADGFEQFVAAVHRVIAAIGHGGYYVFDDLSVLADVWHSDAMLANFFQLTCPYLFDVGAIAYFGLHHRRHAPEAVATIAETAQVLIEVFRHDERLFLHPTKVQQRYAPTMYTLHAWHKQTFVPVLDSATIAEVMAGRCFTLAERPAAGLWNRAFLAAEEALRDGLDSLDHYRRLLPMVVSRDEPVLDLVRRYLSLEDIAALRARMVGTGLIGGKAVGMLLARAIVQADAPEVAAALEPHDSFFVGSDVYYTFLVRNGVWWTREQQRTSSDFLAGAERARQRILVGSFPDHIMQQFIALLDYFGQSPIIVRSSSLLEDNFGNAFAGKYESVFCANQGPRERRLEDFLSAVRTIYASSMSAAALTYRAQRGLLERDERMALLVQRVSGRVVGERFLPVAAGVGFSFNPYAWHERIDPATGVLRLVGGLGTRAVDRADDDYTRIVALNVPELRPEADLDDIRRYTQRRIDAIDLRVGHLATFEAQAVVDDPAGGSLELVVERDTVMERHWRDQGRESRTFRLLTCAPLLRDTRFPELMRRLLSTVAAAYDHPVDIEFTVNGHDDDDLRINLVQCRPLQVLGGGHAIAALPTLDDDQVLVRARGAVVGRSRCEPIDDIIYVVPELYGHLDQQQRYVVARQIETLLASIHDQGRRSLLVGPGRWGTTTPALGVPIVHSSVCQAAALCEIVAMHDGLVPDVSLGTHFFSDLVEHDILYCALFPERAGNRIHDAGLRNNDAHVGACEDAHPALVHLTAAARGTWTLHADALGQMVTVYQQAVRE